MFIPFFEHLRRSGVPVSLREFLGFLEGLKTGLATYDVEAFYYLAFAVNHADFRDSSELWAVVCFVVVLSILVHGLTASGVMTWLDKRRRGRSSS